MTVSDNRWGINVCIDVGISTTLGSIESSIAHIAEDITADSMDNDIASASGLPSLFNVPIPGITSDTSNTHIGASYEVLGCILAHDLEDIDRDDVYTTKYNYNDGMDVVLAHGGTDNMNFIGTSTYDTLSSDIENAPMRCNANAQSWMLDHLHGDANDNTEHANKVENCYLLGRYVTGKQRQERLGSSHITDTQTPHGELNSRVNHSVTERGLGTLIELWKEQMCNQLIGRMTKAYRRGVTCTEIIRICLVSCLYPYLLGSPLFVRELE